MWSYFLLCLFPGVWIGPLQGQPGEGHERLGIRSVQLTGYVHFQNQSEVQGTEKREMDCNIFNLCCFQKWGEAGLLCSTQVLVAFSYIFIQNAGVAVGLGLINRSGNEVWYLWRILDTLRMTKERTWKFNSLLFRGGWGIKFHRTTGWKRRCVIWQRAWIREDCSLRCADAACYCLKGSLCHVVIVPHCPLCWWHCRDWHQAERFGEYNIRVASICYPRPWPGLSHGAMFECSRGCDRVIFADSLEKLKRKVHRGRE